MTDEEIHCNELVELLTEYTEGALPEKDQERIRRHLGYCDGCSALLARLEDVKRLVENASERSEMPENLRVAFERFQSERSEDS